MTLTLRPGEQRFIPDVVATLRAQGASVGPKGPAYAGPLFVRFTAGGTAADGFAASRTSTPAAGGGGYGVSYSGVTLAESASGAAWVFGLQQNAANRSNFAMLNAASNLGPVSLRYPKADVQKWNVILYRNYPRNFRYQMMTAKLPRDESCFICHSISALGVKSAAQIGPLCPVA